MPPVLMDNQVLPDSTENKDPRDLPVKMAPEVTEVPKVTRALKVNQENLAPKETMEKRDNAELKDPLVKEETMDLLVTRDLMDLMELMETVDPRVQEVPTEIRESLVNLVYLLSSPVMKLKPLEYSEVIVMTLIQMTWLPSVALLKPQK